MSGLIVRPTARRCNPESDLRVMRVMRAMFQPLYIFCLLTLSSPCIKHAPHHPHHPQFKTVQRATLECPSLPDCLTCMPSTIRS